MLFLKFYYKRGKRQKNLTFCAKIGFILFDEFSNKMETKSNLFSSKEKEGIRWKGKRNFQKRQTGEFGTLFQFFEAQGETMMKMQWMKWKKKIMAFFMAGVLIGTGSVPAFGADKLYDKVTTQTITKGVTYEKNHRLTTDGWQDIYVMKIPLNDPAIQVAPVESSTEYGLKETVMQLIWNSNAVAGMNASFFGMKGSHSASFGVTIKDGELISVGADINGNGNEYASFFLDQNGTPFLHFLNTKLNFYMDGQSFFEISSINKVTDMVHPMYFDQNAGLTTETLDARFADLAKIVVQDGIITKISEKGEIVEVPENGYLIVMSSSTYDYNVQNFTVGQKAEFTVSTSLDLSQIQMAISGAGLMLYQGEPMSTGLVISGRQPRTALGISQDKTTLILMAVDGRGSSIGATPTEMMYLMMEYGAWDAMHLDGGGSTTVVAKTIEDEALEVKNIPSEGSMRRVINAVGVFNHGPVGELSQIIVKPSSERVFRGTPVTLEVVGYDEYYHQIEVPLDQIVFSSSDQTGIFNGNQFTPSIDGEIILTAQYNGLNSVATVESMTLAELVPNTDTLTLGVGETIYLPFKGISTDGFTAPIGNVTLVSELGTPSGQYFTATAAGGGLIHCSVGDVVCYIALSSGGNIDSVVLPQSTKFTDPMKGTVVPLEPGYQYINLMGQVQSDLPELKEDPVYEQMKTIVNQRIQENANLSVFVGKNDIAMENPVETIHWNSGYHFYDKGNVSIVQMTAAAGTLRTTNTWQWQAFKNDVLKSAGKHVIFILDKSPGGFTDQMEADLFREVLQELDQAGKNIFVVSSGNGSSWDVVKEGIRYIHLPNLWNADGTWNTEFKILTLKLDGESIQYEIKNAM